MLKKNSPRVPESPSFLVRFRRIYVLKNILWAFLRGLDLLTIFVCIGDARSEISTFFALK